MSSFQRALPFALALSLAAPAAWSQTVPTQASPAPSPTVQLPPPPPAAAPAPPASGWPTAARPRRPGLFRERLRMLDRYLLPLPDRSRDSRITSGVIDLAFGAGFVALGFVLQPEDTSTIAPFQALLWTAGGLSVVSGAVTLAWAPARERLGRQYAAMPTTNAQERRARVRFGEQSMDDMAADGVRRRILTAAGSIGVSLITLGILYNEQIFDGAPLPEPAGFNYLVFGTVGLQAVVTLIGAFRRSDEEYLRDNYRRELESLRRSVDTED